MVRTEAFFRLLPELYLLEKLDYIVSFASKDVIKRNFIGLKSGTHKISKNE